jgi:hypothetical protein
MKHQIAVAILALAASPVAIPDRQAPLGVAGCEFPDLIGMTPVDLTAGAGEPSNTGGDIPGGRWELVAVRHGSQFTVTGDAVGAMELNATDASSGDGSVALEVTITSPTNDEIDETGAGPYSASAGTLTFNNDCGADTLISNAEYRVDTSGEDPVMTLWGDIEITDPFPTTIPVETEFLLVEPADSSEVFSDRFEQP